MVFQRHELHYILEDGMISNGSYDLRWESVFNLIGELKTENTVILSRLPPVATRFELQ